MSELTMSGSLRHICYGGGNGPKQKNLAALREKGVLKQYPWGTIATNGTLLLRGTLFSTNRIIKEKRVPL